ncbi:MAG: hypothetical protein HC845_15125 [Akkermansiaceae bacterium]|nr:hypothetical protein [Akkermansiaceae bacterium]
MTNANSGFLHPPGSFQAKIAHVSGWSGVRQWNKFPEQTSASVALVAGQKYYIEALMKEGYDLDHLEIAWKTPGSSSINIIPGSALEGIAYDPADPDGDGMPSTWETANGLNPSLNDAALDPDLDGIHNLLEYLSGTNPQVKEPFGLAAEFWTNLPEYSTRALVENRKFYGAAQSISTISGATTGEQASPSQNFAARGRGYLVAPATGSYRFWISGRNGVELYLSTNSTKYAKRRIAEINPDIGGGHGIGFYDTNYWDQFGSQQSVDIQLEEGQTYFIEVLQVNGHVSNPHFSVAWAPPGEGRAQIPAINLLPYTVEAADADDDYLPDQWESQKGLNPADNGYTDLAKQGERGDFDSDGLSNRSEYLLGTDPANADTDGDGETDGNEVNGLGTNALVANSLAGAFLSDVALGSYISSSNPWTMTSGGLISDSFRGEVSWNFSVPSAGNWLLRLNLELMGATYGNEEVPIAIKVNGKTVIRKRVNFGSGKFSVLQALTHG